MGDACLPRPAHQLFSLKLLGFTDTEEFKYRNARLSHEFGIVTFIYNHTYRVKKLAKHRHLKKCIVSLAFGYRKQSNGDEVYRK